MIRFFESTLTRRLAALFGATAVVPVVVVSAIAFVQARSALRDQIYEELTAIRELKHEELALFCKDHLSTLTVLAGSRDIREAFTSLKAYHDTGGATPEGPYETETDEFRTIYEQIDAILSPHVTAHDYDDLMLVCAAHGHVMYTASKRTDLGQNLRFGELRGSGLAKAWQRVIEKKKPMIFDHAEHSPREAAPVVFMGAPVLDEKAEMVAVMILSLGSEVLSAMIHAENVMGETGQIYLVGEDQLLRTSGRGQPDSVILEARVDTHSARSVVAHREGTETDINADGVEVLSSYSHLALDDEFGVDFDWFCIAEMTTREAFAPVRTLAWEFLWLSLVVAVVACVVGASVARGIAGPLRESASNLASAIGEISATSSQLAANASETSAAITEVTTTAEEARQTSEASNDMARSVAKRSERMIDVARVGGKATEDAGSGMGRIKEEMQRVAEGIIKLSEQTQNIGEIIGTVNDLAEQSNLLSVNAAIEAAKAGEFGKGFAVVAQEVRSLADQSRAATDQVRSILNDIQSATSAAVMATERATKSVENGVTLSAQAGEAIGALSSSVTGSVDAATQIAASSQQQLVGMDQLVNAMANIREATVQNVAGAKQLESASAALDELARKLEDMA